MHNTANLGKSIFKWFCTLQDLLLDPRTTKHICAAFSGFRVGFFAIDKQEAIAPCNNEIQMCYVYLLFLIIIIPRLQNGRNH